MDCQPTGRNQSDVSGRRSQKSTIATDRGGDSPEQGLADERHRRIRGIAEEPHGRRAEEERRAAPGDRQTNEPRQHAELPLRSHQRAGSLPMAA
jgi:hypothetical protein